MSLKKYNFSNIFKVVMLFFCILLSQNAYAEEYFTTDSFDVSVIVHEDKRIEIKEDITVSFFEARHGLFRYIPKKGKEYRYINNILEEKEYMLNIVHPEVQEHEYIFGKTNEEYYYFQIGSKEKKVDGKQFYSLSYDVLLRDDLRADFDDFYYNIIPHSWRTEIKNATITVVLPKGFDSNAIELITGFDGGENTKKASYTRQGNSLKISLNEKLNTYEGLTLRILLPEGYFTDSDFLSSWEILVLSISFITALISLCLWFFFVRKKPMPEPLSFYPPHNYTPAQMAYIYKSRLSLNDFSSMLIYFANKDYITLDTQAEGQFFISKKNPLPDDAKAHEKNLYSALFANTDSLDIKNSSKELYLAFNEGRSSLIKEFKQETQKIFSKKNIFLSIAFIILSILPCFALNFGDYTYYEDALIFTFASWFAPAFCAFVKYQLSKKKKTSLAKAIILSTVLLIATSPLFFLSLLQGDELYNNVFIGIFSLSSTILSLFLATKDYSRTEYGLKILGEIKGFMNFINVSEKDKINALVEQNPHYFFDILPYAYVFGLSTKWINKLKLVQIPESEFDKFSRNYNDRDAFSNMNKATSYTAAALAVSNIDALIDATEKAVVREVRSRTSSSGNNGGGRSSGGGGSSSGSSGGGAGGGGGGSW